MINYRTNLGKVARFGVAHRATLQLSVNELKRMPDY